MHSELSNDVSHVVIRPLVIDLHTSQPQLKTSQNAIFHMPSNICLFRCFHKSEELFRMSYYHLNFLKSKNIHSDLSIDVSNVVIRPLDTYHTHVRSSVLCEIPHICLFSRFHRSEELFRMSYYHLNF